MARNVYFSQAVKSEQNLYEDLIIESLKIFGQDIYYLPRTLVSRDDILGEDRGSKFDDAYPLEAYVDNFDGYGQNPVLLTKFGIEATNEITLIISRVYFSFLLGLSFFEIQTSLFMSKRPFIDPVLGQ